MLEIKLSYLILSYLIMSTYYIYILFIIYYIVIYLYISVLFSTSQIYKVPKAQFAYKEPKIEVV